VAQMGRIEELLAKRERVAGWYNERLARLEGIQRPAIVATTTRMSWFVYVVRVRPPAERDEIVRQLAAQGIPSRPYFTPIHLQPFYRERYGYRRGDFPVTERLGDVSLALPFSSVMSEEQVERVCSALEDAARQVGAKHS
jgi:perosamine synthetase